MGVYQSQLLQIHKCFNNHVIYVFFALGLCDVDKSFLSTKNWSHIVQGHSGSGYYSFIMVDLNMFKHVQIIDMFNNSKINDKIFKDKSCY